MTETSQLIERISKTLGVTPDTLVTGGVKEYLKTMLRATKAETHELETRYQVKTPQELEEKIRQGQADEHPAWEDLIQYENLVQHTKKLEKELNSLN
jgi:hypothetical protein